MFLALFNFIFIRDGLFGCKEGSNPSGWMTEEEKSCILLSGNHSSQCSHIFIEGLNFVVILWTFKKIHKQRNDW